MRHTVFVKSSPKIRKGELTYFVNSLQDGDFVKLSQQDRHIYLVYRMTENMGQKQLEVNDQILSLNGLTDDTTSTI